MQADQIVALRSRRRFFTECGRAALGLPFLSLAGCLRQESTTPIPTDTVGSTGNWDALIADLEKQLPALLSQATTVPAVSMALVADAKLRWRGAFGVKDFASKAPVDHDTIYEAGSVSKTVFAYAVLKLCERGLLSLDTPLTKYTSDRYLEGDPRLDLITARHVLSHTTGFQNWRSSKEPLAIHFSPGARWDYSGEGYSYLQSVVTHLSGHVDPNRCRTFEDHLRVCATDFDAYMRANLFAPFGMTSSGYLYQEGMARPHDDKGRMNADRKATAIEAARYGSAGELHTTPTDYARFLIELMDPKPSDAYRLTAATLKEMVRPQVKVTDAISWGLGWAIEHKKSGGDIISHSGDNPGFKALTAASLEKKSGFIIMTNGDRGFDDVIARIVKSERMQQFLPVTLGA
jgi:CubicO group peptidase (beta-lactamase class C family)